MASESIVDDVSRRALASLSLSGLYCCLPTSGVTKSKFVDRTDMPMDQCAPRRKKKGYL